MDFDKVDADWEGNPCASGIMCFRLVQQLSLKNRTKNMEDNVRLNSHRDGNVFNCGVSKHGSHMECGSSCGLLYFADG